MPRKNLPDSRVVDTHHKSLVEDTYRTSLRDRDKSYGVKSIEV